MIKHLQDRSAEEHRESYLYPNLGKYIFFKPNPPKIDKDEEFNPIMCGPTLAIPKSNLILYL